MAEMDFRAHQENAASQQSSFGSSVQRVVDHPDPNTLGLVITCLVLRNDVSVGLGSSGSLRGRWLVATEIAIDGEGAVCSVLIESIGEVVTAVVTPLDSTAQVKRRPLGYCSYSHHQDWPRR